MVLQPGRRPRGRHHRGAAGRAAPQTGLGHLVGCRRQGHRPAGVRQAASATRPDSDARRAVRGVRRPRQGRSRRRGPRPARAEPWRGVPGLDQGDRHRAQRRQGHRRHHHRRRDARPTSWCPAAGSGVPNSAHWSGWTSRCCHLPTSTPRRTRSPNLSDATPSCRRRASRSCVIRTRTSTSASTWTASASAPTPTARCRWTCAISRPARSPSRRDAVDARLHRGGFRAGVGGVQAAAALPGDCHDRRRVQRDLLLHPRRRAVDRRIPRRRRLLDRRGRVGDAFRRRRPRGGAAADRRPLGGRAARLRRAPLRRGPAGPRLRQRDVTAELRRDLRHPASPAAQGVSAQSAGQPVPSPGSANSARSSSRTTAGNVRTGTRPTPRCSTSCPPSGSLPPATTGPRCSTRPSPPPKPGVPVPRWPCTT